MSFIFILRIKNKPETALNVQKQSHTRLVSLTRNIARSEAVSRFWTNFITPENKIHAQISLDIQRARE